MQEPRSEYPYFESQHTFLRWFGAPKDGDIHCSTSPRCDLLDCTAEDLLHAELRVRIWDHSSCLTFFHVDNRWVLLRRVTLDPLFS